jgi:hypothetical protein
LNLDELARVFGDVEPNRVGCGARRKLLASMAAKPGVAHFTHASFVGLNAALGSAANA